MALGRPVGSFPSSQIVTLVPNTRSPSSTQARPSSRANPENAMKARYSSTSATAYSPRTTVYSPGAMSTGLADRAARSAASRPTASASMAFTSVLNDCAYPVSPPGPCITVRSLDWVTRCEAIRPRVLATVMC